jgi:diguanylate cyclase (GGDEF)-like protein/PAS domain S-box-containing protein
MFENNLAVKLIIRPEDGAIIDMNRAGLQFYGYSAEDLEHLTVADLDASGGSCLEKGTADESGVYLGAQNNEAKQLCFQSRHRLKNGEIRDVEIYSGPLDFQGISYRYSIIHDVSERKAAERHMLHQAHYDALTNIPNRFLALDRLSQLMIEATRQSDKLAVMFLDLDDFKKINDSLGHESGDLLLIEASRRLTAVTRADDTVGRLGGDEFIILLRGLKTVIPAQHVAESILEQFRKPFLIDGHELILTVSIGIAIYPTDGKDTSSLLRHSDIAMYKAKERGRNTYSFFTDSMNQAVSYRLSLEEQLHGALKRGELEVYYQPQVDLASSEVIGAEALLRWHNHVLGDVSPVDFIPVAEHTGLIVSIGKFVITQVLDTLVECCDKRTDKQGDFRIAVNLSPRQLRDLSLVSFVTEALEKANLDSHSLELEITEGVLMMGHGYIDDSLKRLSEAGIAISMDDFGTGYSSLSYLRQYPFDLLKIDRSFVDGVAEAGADRELVLATIAMAHALGLKVIAEGVETEAQRDALKQLQCDYAQGYLYGKAAPKAAFFKLIGLAG